MEHRPALLTDQTMMNAHCHFVNHTVPGLPPLHQGTLLNDNSTGVTVLRPVPQTSQVPHRHSSHSAFNSTSSSRYISHVFCGI